MPNGLVSQQQGRAGRAFGEEPRALFLLGGLVSIAFGVVLFARPGVGAVTLALLFGLFALFYGISRIAAGIQLRGAEPSQWLARSASSTSPRSSW